MAKTASRPVASSSKLQQAPQQQRRSSRPVKSQPTVSTAVKGAKRARTKEKGLSEKKKGKRRRMEEPEEEEDEEAVEEEGDDAKEDEEGADENDAGLDDNQGTSLTKKYSLFVSKKTVARSWKKLSLEGKMEVRSSLEETALELLASLDTGSRGKIQGVLNEAFDEIMAELNDVQVPPPSHATAGKKSSSSNTVDILSAEELRERMVLLEAALIPELGEVKSLEKALEKEKKLLEADEARLSSFETARAKVERAEAKESHKHTHPLALQLLNSQKKQERQSSSLEDALSGSKLSHAWFSENLPCVAERTLSREVDEDSEDEEGSKYDPTKDDYSMGISKAIAGSLEEIEVRLEGLKRVRTVVGQAEKAIVSLV